MREQTSKTESKRLANGQKERTGAEHPATRKKSRWWPTSRGAIRIFAVLASVGALMVVFRGFYLEDLQKSPSTILGAVTAVVAVVVLIRVGQQYQWTGFGEAARPKSEDQEIQPRKTLWDWLQLFIVPLALAAIGLWFAAQQETRQQQIEAKRAKSERHIEEQRAQDAALQAYLDQMSQLMLGGDLRGSERDSEVRTLARARTRTVLGRLNSSRQGSVVQFLYEASLIDKEHPIVSLAEVRLRGADLSGAYLIEADLAYADLTDADLSGASLNDADLSETTLDRADLGGAALGGADLDGAELEQADLSGTTGLIKANLSGATLSGATLSGAYLRGADLRETYLNEADLRGADLRGAYLRDADLIGADLDGAYLTGADLTDADLSGAKGVSEEQLVRQAKSLEGATMPDQSIHD